MEATLTKLGLTKIEAKIYIALLDLGPSLAGAITRKSGIHRRSVYDATARLAKKGLVGYIKKNNRKYFEASAPQHLQLLLEEKEAALATVMPKLEQKFLQKNERQETNFYRGVNGLKKIFEEQLQCRKEIAVLGATSHAKEILQFYMHWYEQRRRKKKIPIKLLYHEGNRKERIMPHAEVKYLPKKYESPAAINVYGDTVAIIHWDNEEPSAVVIRSKEIAQSYKNYFLLLWKMAKR